MCGSQSDATDHKACLFVFLLKIDLSTHLLLLFHATFFFFFPASDSLWDIITQLQRHKGRQAHNFHRPFRFICVKSRKWDLKTRACCCFDAYFFSYFLFPLLDFLVSSFISVVLNFALWISFYPVCLFIIMIINLNAFDVALIFFLHIYIDWFF